jgi:hypothetical protein
MARSMLLLLAGRTQAWRSGPSRWVGGEIVFCVVTCAAEKTVLGGQLHALVGKYVFQGWQDSGLAQWTK